jgi:hypothetical protein
MDRPTGRQVSLLCWFPDYSKDADAVRAALPYNPVSRLQSAIAQGNLRAKIDDG